MLYYCPLGGGGGGGGGGERGRDRLGLLFCVLGEERCNQCTTFSFASLEYLTECKLSCKSPSLIITLCIIHYTEIEEPTGCFLENNSVN